MKPYKRVLAVILCVVMTLTAAPLSGFVGIDLPSLFDFTAEAAEEGEVYSGTCGENLTWTLDSKGNLVISGTGEMYDFGDMYDFGMYDYVPWSYYNVTSVEIENGVTSIGGNAFYGYDITAVSIPDSVTKIGLGAFANCDELANIVLPDGLLSIEQEAFSGCDCLESVTIPDSVTKIGLGAFANCDELANIVLPDGLLSIEQEAFSGCDCLESVTIPKSVTSIGQHAFRGANLTSLKVDEDNRYYSSDDYGVLFNKDKTVLVSYLPANTSSSYTIPDGVVSFGDFAFAGCTNLKTVNIPDSVVNINYGVFCDCINLTDIIIPNNVKEIGWFAFADCYAITSIIIPDSVTVIDGAAFEYCYNLSEVKIGNGVTTIGGAAFENCDSLTSVTIPDSVTTIGDSAFSCCDSITSLTIGNSVTTIGKGAFWCDSLTSIIVDKDNQYYSSDSYGVLFNKDKTTLIHYPIGSIRTSYTIPDSVTTIGEYAFDDCSSLTSVTIPDSVKSIGNYTFWDCTSLTDVYYTGTEVQWNNISIGSDNSPLTSATIHFKDVDYSGTCGDNLTWSLNTGTGVLNISGTGAMTNYTNSSSVPWSSYRSYIKTVNIGNSVTTIGNSAFFYCDNLTSVTIGDGVITIGNFAFECCYRLTSITIPGSVTKICDGAFDNCDSLTNITVDEINQYYSSDSYGVLFNKDKTELIQYPAGNTRENYSIPDSVTTIDGCAFSNCDSLTSVTIPERVTAIADWVFGNCNSLTSITIPDSVTSIGDFAFIGCNSLTSITIPDGVTTIGDEAFEDCDSLASIRIPGSVISIGNSTFDNCDSLTNITVDKINQYYSSDSYGVLFNKDKTELIQYPAGNTRTNYAIPDTVTTIGDGAFEGCDSLTSVAIPDSINTIGIYAFAWCDSLISVTIPNGINAIGIYTFAWCDSLASVSIPCTVTSIGAFAFEDCGILANVYFGGTGEQWNQIIIDEYNEVLTSATIHFNVEDIPEEPTTAPVEEPTTVPVTEEPGTVPTTIPPVIPTTTVPPTTAKPTTTAPAPTTTQPPVTVPPEIETETTTKAPATEEPTTVPIPSYDYSGKCGNNLTWTLNKSTGVLNIAGTGAMTNYSSSSSAPWYSYRRYIKSVNIGNSVTTIGYEAFYNCTSLTSVTIPDSVTTIGDGAFDECESLTSVTIGNSVTTIGYEAFYNCTSLTSVTIPDSVTSIGGYAFYGCDSLTSVTIPDSVTTIGVYAFFNCDSLTSVTIGNSVTAIGWAAFAYCTSLTSVTIPDSVTTIGSNAFSDCTSLTSVTIGNSVKTIGNYAFSYCDSLTSVTIGNSVTTIGYKAFYNCTSLTSVTIPDSVTSIGDWAFASCDSLTSVTIPDSVTTIGRDAFFHCTSLTSVTIPDRVTTIGDWAFASCDSLTSVTIPDSVTTIGSEAFAWCDSLTSVTIPDSVTTISYRAFSNCTSLTSVTIPDSVTTIGDYAFYSCDSLTSITVDKNNKYYSSDSYGVLFNKDKTTLIQYPIGNTRISYVVPDSVTTIGSEAFFHCDSLTSVTIGNSVTTIGEGAFYDCDSLTSVTIPDSVTTIGDYAFEYCDSLTSVTIPDSVITIGNDAFYDCTSLTSVTIPDSVTTIGDYAFFWCDSLKDVYYTGTGVQWNKISIGSKNEDLTSATIHYNSTGPNSFIYSQAHVVGNYKDTNADYAAKYFAGAAQPMDGTNGTPDLCIPGLSLGENMVPQGIAYYPAKNWLLVSSYYKDAETDSYPCYIYALDFTTGKMVAEYKIKDSDGSTFAAHVGGIAVSDYNLYITGEDADICKVSLTQLDKKSGEIVIEDKTSMSEWLGDANTAYLSINDGMLITGNFFYAKDSKYDTPAKAANSVILAQNLSGNSSVEEWKNFCNSGPFAVVKVPDSVDRIQGVVYRDEKFFISSSLGRRNTSSLIIADIDKSNGYTLKNIYRFQVPPMMEGLTFADDYIYIVFESAAAFYREGLDGEGKSVNPTDVVWRLNYNEWLGIDDTPTVTGDVENKYVQYVHGGTTGYTYLNFKQNWFNSDSMNYNHNLATLASQYVMIGYADEVSYSSKPDLEKALKAIGMSDIEIVAQAGRDEINYFIASRKITVNSQEYDLVFVGLIGSYHAQWYSNFDPGKGAIHKGFLSAKQFVYSALTDYIKDKGLSKDSTKILITGHSRGAAASNLLAADLIKGGVFAKPENIYTYCFATPNSTTLPERNEQRFKRIFNIVNPEDFVTKVLPTAWGYGRYGTTYVLPSKTNTTSSLYSAYRTNMQHYYGAFTQGDTYRPYIGGEADTRLVVESMISSIDNVNEFYDKTLWVGIIPMSAYDFFQNSLCHIVSKEASAADWANLAIIVEGTLTIPTSSPVFKNVLAYFLMNGTGLNPCFENAHKAETYCAYMMSMTETQVKQTRKGYLNTVNCPVDIEVIDKVTGEVVGRIVNNVVDEEIAAKENSIVMNVDGDSKSFWLPSDGDYEVRLIGNDEGTMDYTVAEIDPDIGETERINFFDVEIDEGKEFTGDVPAYDFEIDEYTLKTDSGEEVPDQKLDAESGEITINTSVEGDGYVTESFNVKSGDYVTVSAQPFVTAKFVKWVDSSGNTLSTDAEYSFVAKENTSIKAVFTTATGISIRTPSTTTVNYGDTLILHADFGDIVLPEGYSILWTVEGAGFNMAPADDGLTCNMTSVANGNATVKATLVDENGEAVLDADGNEMSDTQELKSNASFWQKIVSFFKNLFRINRIIPE